jgi:hydroxymethylpyrimidine/phosphomethylpyrimidine kinase
VSDTLSAPQPTPCPSVLCIAGSDSSGCAGLQADLATLHAFGVHGACAITTVTTQTASGVLRMDPLCGEAVRAQIESALTELQPGAVKIGMIGPAEVVAAIRSALHNYTGPVVFDPVLGSSSGAPFRWQVSPAEAARNLFPITTLLTPNLPEAYTLAALPAPAAAAIRADAAPVSDLDAGDPLHVWCAQRPFALLLKGGHAHGAQLRDTLFQPNGSVRHYRHPRIETSNSRGTGCTLASGIAAGLALGLPLEEAIGNAITHLESALFASRHRPRRYGLLHPPA